MTKEKKRDIIKEKEDKKGGDIYNEKDNRNRIWDKRKGRRFEGDRKKLSFRCKLFLIKIFSNKEYK